MPDPVDVKAEEECLDLSIKDAWVIVHYQDCDPGNEFEILHHTNLAESSWNTLRKGVFVTVMFGSAKVQAIVAYVSDDKSFLQSNFESIGEEFLQEYYGETNMSKIIRKRRHRRRKITTAHCTREKIKVIKVTDKECQTDDYESTKYTALENDYNELKTKYDQLEQKLQGFQKDITTVLTKIDPNVQANSTEPKCQPSTSGIRNQPKQPKEPKRKPFGGNGDKFQRKYPNTKCLTKLGNKQTKDVVVDENDENIVLIGTNRTKIQRHVFETINWYNYSTATRKLLMHVFPRSTLATHSLTGKPSPAFLTTDKQAKMKLNPSKIGDIVETVSRKCSVTESLVRSAITTKCADENKMYKKRMEKRLKEEVEEEVQIKKVKTR